MRARRPDHPAGRWAGRGYVEAVTEAELVAAVRSADRSGDPALVLGGGSNLLVADEGFDGTVVAVRTRGVTSEVDDCAGAGSTWRRGSRGTRSSPAASLRAGPGWRRCPASPGWSGRRRSRTSGRTASRSSETVARVRTFDRRRDAHRTFAAADCGFGYRTSVFKSEPGRYVVLGVQLPARAAASAPSRSATPSSPRVLGVEVGDRAPLADARAAVLALRRRKGMVLDAADHDTWSAGSFFTNPVLGRTPRPRPARGRAPAARSRTAAVRTSAAWLIEHAGFGRGYGGPGGRVRRCPASTRWR